MSVLDSGGMQLYRTGVILLGRCSSSCLCTVHAVRNQGSLRGGVGGGAGGSSSQGRNQSHLLQIISLPLAEAQDLLAVIYK